MTELAISYLSDRFEQALVYAARLHANQVRKGGSVPYISHLISVAALVLEDGGDEDAAIAALLHDAIEDQGASRSEIQARFGDRVLQIVETCTESDQIPKPPWKQRKLQAIARLQQAEPDVQRVMVADKLHNLRSIWADWQRQGDWVWERFNADRTAVLWFYAACVAAVRDRDSATHSRAATSDRGDRDRLESPMVTELQTLLDQLIETALTETALTGTTMAKPIFKLSDQPLSNNVMARLVEFEIPNGVTTPEQFAAAVQEIESQLAGSLPILINGRGPVWGYGMIFHAAHPSPTVATYDPRLGYVIVQTHDERFQVGKILEL